MNSIRCEKPSAKKTAFIDYVTRVATEQGYSVQVEKSALGARNIVVGDLEKAKVVYTAHYDTCAALPFPNLITPKNFPLYLLYQLVITAVILAVMFGLIWLVQTALAPLNLLPRTLYFVRLAVMLIVLLALFNGPANKHTANDNTSGVTVLLDVMAALSAEQREQAAFVFFDLEESGTLGSMSFKRKHKQTMCEKLLINFDCVSDGDTMLMVLKKKAVPFRAVLEAAFPTTDAVKAEIVDHGVFYPSDQAWFPCGVGVAALKRTKKRGILYMDRIHTNRDTVYREENIAYLTQGAVALVSQLQEEA